MAHTPLFRSFILALQRARRDNLSAVGKPPPLTRGEALWTRRRFLRTAALAAGSAFATGMLPRRDRAWSEESPKPPPEIAVIGGGLAGLNAAFQLQKAGYTATIYEARHRLGGRILSVTGAVGEGLVTDLGGQLINTDHADMLALVEAFGLRLFNRTKDAERLPFPETAYYFDGRSRSEAEVADQLRPLAQQIAADAALLDQDLRLRAVRPPLRSTLRRPVSGRPRRQDPGPIHSRPHRQFDPHRIRRRAPRVISPPTAVQPAHRRGSRRRGTGEQR